jgi:hypothetical protein
MTTTENLIGLKFRYRERKNGVDVLWNDVSLVCIGKMMWFFVVVRREVGKVTMREQVKNFLVGISPN